MKVGGYSGSLTRFSSLLPKKVHWVKKIDTCLQWFGFFVSFWGGFGVGLHSFIPIFLS